MSLTIPVHDFPQVAQLLAPLAFGIAWFLPGLATLVSNAFGAFAKKKARGQAQQQVDQKWRQYQSDWTKWRDDQNARNEALSRYITEQGWDERLGPLKAKMVAPIVGNAPGGNAPRVGGSFWDDFLGATAGALPQLMLQFGSRGGFPGGAPPTLPGQETTFTPGRFAGGPGGTAFERTGWDPSFEAGSSAAPYYVAAPGQDGGGTDDMLAQIFGSGFNNSRR